MEKGQIPAVVALVCDSIVVLSIWVNVCGPARARPYLDGFGHEFFWPVLADSFLFF